MAFNSYGLQQLWPTTARISPRHGGIIIIIRILIIIIRIIIIIMIIIIMIIIIISPSHGGI